MHKQLIISALTFFFFTLAAAKNAENQTLIVPSPQNEKSSEAKDTPKADLEASGLDSNYVPLPPEKTAKYHLPPSSSATLALSLADDFSSKDTTGWFGIHVAPWMDATNRIQVGLDVHDKTGLLQVAYHSLYSRTRSRYYWGVGASMNIDSEEKLSNIVEFENYYLFLSLGWDFQIAWRHSLRAEISYHQGTEDNFAKLTGGYTYHF